MAIIQTTIGEMDESLLWKREGFVEDENEYTTFVEYWHPRAGRALSEKTLVHRSVAVAIKDGIETTLEAEALA